MACTESARRKIWIIAGEASGDIYGAGLCSALRERARQYGEQVDFSGMGASEMRAAGVDILVDSTELGVVGLFEVLRHLFTFIGIFFRLVRRVRHDRPDAVVLIDYPGFNLCFASALYCCGIPVVWYVCPQLWMWGKWRLPVLAGICRKMLVIFPFEVEVFAGSGLKVEFVGHPLVDIMAAQCGSDVKRDDNCILLLPGSRRMEVEGLLDNMLDSVMDLAAGNPELYYHLSSPREKIAELCREKIEAYRLKHPELPEIQVSCGDTVDWLRKGAAGMAAGGTVTLEAAIAGIPLVVGYKLNWMTYILVKLFIRFYRGFFTIANIVADERVFPEFMQYKFRRANVAPAVKAMLPGGPDRARVDAGMRRVVEMLDSGAGGAYAAAAAAVWNVLK